MTQLVFGASKGQWEYVDVDNADTPEGSETGHLADNPSPKRHRSWNVWKTLALIVVAGLAGLAVLAEYAAHHAEPLLRAAVVESLENRFHETVELDHLSVSVIHGLQVQGAGLRLYPAPDVHTPVADFQSFSFYESIDDLLHLRARVDTIYVEGLVVHIPPRSMRSLAVKKTPHPVIKLTVGKIVCHDALLVIDTDKPDKRPLQFQIADLTLQDIGNSNAFLYRADLINPKPKGRIQVAGHFGPWRADSPRDTPIDGDYTFSQADLGTIKGLSGTLDSTGRFTGVLSNLVVDGTTHSPNFALDIGDHPMRLDTVFHAIVDGTTGDTTLQPVQARLANTSILAAGTVKRIPLKSDIPGDLGHDIALDVKVPRGRIEDLLQLAIKSEPPLMRGALTLQGKLHIPPGHVRVAQKMQLAATLHIDGVEFTGKTVQDRVDGLSMRAQGRPQDVKMAEHDNKPEVASQMTVQFVLGGSLIRVDSLHYELPGAKVQMVGAYTLDSHLFNFEGHVQTDAKASQMVTGWKSALLRPFDGMLEKNGAGMQLPISVSGVNGDYKFGLHDSKQSADQMAAQLRNHPH